MAAQKLQQHPSSGFEVLYESANIQSDTLFLYIYFFDYLLINISSFLYQIKMDLLTRYQYQIPFYLQIFIFVFRYTQFYIIKTATDCRTCWSHMLFIQKWHIYGNYHLAPHLQPSLSHKSVRKCSISSDDKLILSALAYLTVVKKKKWIEWNTCNFNHNRWRDGFSTHV